MKFAEITQEVQISRPTPVKPDMGLTPGRRKANQLFRVACNNLDELGHPEAKSLDIDLGLVYSLGSSFPNVQLNSPEAHEIIQQLQNALEQRIQKRKILLDDFNARRKCFFFYFYFLISLSFLNCIFVESNFRMALLEIERENLKLKTENASLKAILGQERQRTVVHENKIIIHESSIDQLNKKLKNRENELHSLQTQLNHKQQLLTQREMEKEKQKKRFNSKIAVEQDKAVKEMETRLQQQQNEMQV